MTALRKTHQIQDFTTIGSVGDLNQQMAGHIPALEEPGIAEADRIALYLLDSNNGSGLIQDETGNYNLTNYGATNGVGILGGSFGAANFATTFLHHPTLLNTPPTSFACGIWMRHDTLTTSRQRIWSSYNSATNYIVLSILNKRILVESESTGSGSSSVIGLTELNAGQWYHIVVTWNTTYGVQVFLNSKLEGEDSAQNVLFAAGSTSGFTLGGHVFDGVPTLFAEPFDGRLSNCELIDKVLEQRHIDMMYSTKYTWDGQDNINDTELIPFAKEGADDDFISQLNWGGMEVARLNNEVYRYGSLFKSTDKLKILGRGL
jgi:hypothetical protein